jgi:hypothetical protein
MQREVCRLIPSSTSDDRRVCFLFILYFLFQDGIVLELCTESDYSLSVQYVITYLVRLLGAVKLPSKF